MIRIAGMQVRVMDGELPIDAKQAEILGEGFATAVVKLQEGVANVGEKLTDAPFDELFGPARERLFELWKTRLASESPADWEQFEQFKDLVKQLEKDTNPDRTVVQLPASSLSVLHQAVQELAEAVHEIEKFTDIKPPEQDVFLIPISGAADDITELKKRLSAATNKVIQDFQVELGERYGWTSGNEEGAMVLNPPKALREVGTPPVLLCGERPQMPGIVRAMLEEAASMNPSDSIAATLAKELLDSFCSEDQKTALRDGSGQPDAQQPVNA